jgi:hypothetical protein
MAQKTHVHPADVHGISRLAIEATLGLTSLVEAVHASIADAPPIPGTSAPAATSGIAGLVYESVRGIARLVGSGLDAALGQLASLLGQPSSSPERDAMLAALNGVLGDYLVTTGNPLALSMSIRQHGQALGLAAPSPIATIPQPTGDVLVLGHGLCLNDLGWLRNGHDHGARLAADLGYTPVYLHYNTGLHISANGRAFASMLEALLERWPVPVERLAIVGHSMGGLVTRSACHYGALAGHTWPRRLRKIVFLGTPHHGAPLERVGNWVNTILDASPYTAAFARLGKLRSAGITDLGYGKLLDADWAGLDRFAHDGDMRRPVPLPEGVQCYAIAATTGKTAGDLRDHLLGDGLVPVRSALGHHHDPSLAVPFPKTRQWIGYEMGHLDLLHHPDVYEQLRRWLDY